MPQNSEQAKGEAVRRTLQDRATYTDQQTGVNYVSKGTRGLKNAIINEATRKLEVYRQDHPDATKEDLDRVLHMYVKEATNGDGRNIGRGAEYLKEDGVVDPFLREVMLAHIFEMQNFLRDGGYRAKEGTEGKTAKDLEPLWNYDATLPTGLPEAFLPSLEDFVARKRSDHYERLAQGHLQDILRERQSRAAAPSAGASPEAQAALAASRTGTPAAPTSPTPTPAPRKPSKKEMRARERVLEALGVKDTSDLKSPTKLFEYLKALGDEGVTVDADLDLPGVRTKDASTYERLLGIADRYSLSRDHKNLYLKDRDGKLIGLLYEEGKGKVSAKVYSKPVEKKEVVDGVSVFRTKKLLEKLGDEDLEEGKDFYVRKGIFRDRVTSLTSKGRKVIEGIAESKNRNGVDYILVGGGGAVGATIALGAATIIAPPVGAAVIATSLLLGAVTGASGGKAVSCAEGIFSDGEKKKIKFGGVEVVTEAAEAPKKKKTRAAEVIVELPAPQAPAATPEDAAEADKALKELANLVGGQTHQGMTNGGGEMKPADGEATDPAAALKKYSDDNARERQGAAVEAAAGTEAKATV